MQITEISENLFCGTCVSLGTQVGKRENANYTGRVVKLRFFELGGDGRTGEGWVLSFFKDEHLPGWQTMIRIAFREDEIERLRRERFGHPHPRVQRKMEALLLKSECLPHHQMTRIVGVSENTLRQYLRENRAGGIERRERDSILPSTQ